MNKEFEYKNYNFNINVEMEAPVEVAGMTSFTIICNGMGYTNYYDKKSSIQSAFLELGISAAEIRAKKFVDDREDGEQAPDKRLTDLGFK